MGEGYRAVFHKQLGNYKDFEELSEAKQHAVEQMVNHDDIRAVSIYELIVDHLDRLLPGDIILELTWKINIRDYRSIQRGGE